MTAEQSVLSVRVLLYGDVNLNLLDGSALWLTSMAQVLPDGIPLPAVVRGALDLAAEGAGR